MAVSQPAPLPPRPDNARYASFDIWRGFACLALLFYHSAFYAEHAFRVHDTATWSLGSIGIRLAGFLWVGVPFFFVISGYCIAASVDGLRRKPHSLRDYFRRRIRRIYPPFWAALALAVMFCLVAGLNPVLFARCTQLAHPTEFTAWHWLGNFLAAEAWMPRLSGASAPNYLMSNTWTLCYEEQFYALAGLMLFLAARRFFLAAVVLSVLTLCVRHVGRANGWDAWGFFCDGHWLLFAAGIFVYHGLHYASRQLRWATLALFAAGAVYAVCDRQSQTSYHQRHLDEYLVASCLFAMALMLGRRFDRAIADFRPLQPLAWCGRISYSIYLTHFPIVVVMACLFSLTGLGSDSAVLFIGMPASLAISLPVAWLFYNNVERHFMNVPSKARTKASNTRLAGAT
ncbi:MAG: acyltransferase family protein [Pirellulales bacterium]